MENVNCCILTKKARYIMIDTNMNVIFTGTQTLEKTHYNSLLDGEHIKYDKNNNYVLIYLLRLMCTM